MKKYKGHKNLKILDWGCGPGRIIRHLPEFLGDSCTFFGTDYNAGSIQWCTENLQNINFNLNGIEAKLPYPDNFFDFIYGLSVFTHLSEENHYSWRKELFRILKHDGILFITTQGDNFKIKLTPKELYKFEKGELVVRGNVKEGHRTYSAFQSDVFMKQLFENDGRILEHIKQVPIVGKYLPQDIWIVQKV